MRAWLGCVRETKGIPKDKTIVFLPEGSARPLIAIQDEEIKEKAIIKCMERLNGEIGAGRGNTKKLTVGDVAKIIRTMVGFNPGNIYVSFLNPAYYH